MCKKSIPGSHYDSFPKSGICSVYLRVFRPLPYFDKLVAFAVYQNLDTSFRIQERQYSCFSSALFVRSLGLAIYVRTRYSSTFSPTYRFLPNTSANSDAASPDYSLCCSKKILSVRKLIHSLFNLVIYREYPKLRY